MLLNRISGLGMAIIFSCIFPIVSLAQAAVVKVQPTEEKAAIVNGKPIYMDELEGEILVVQRSILGYGKPLTVKQVSNIQKEVLESLVRREILYQESLKTGIKPDENMIDKEIKELKQKFPSEADYMKELSNRHVSEEMLRYRMQRNSSMKQYIEKLASQVTLTDDEIVSYYQAHLDAFRQPMQMRVSHILIQSDPKWEAARKQEARHKAEQVLKDLKKGKDFSALARELSDGPTRTNGGDLGYIRMGQLDKQLENAVFGLKSGEISELVVTEHGYHLFKVTDKKNDTVLAYEDVKEKIRQFLREEKAKQEAELQAKKLREKENVEILIKE